MGNSKVQDFSQEVEDYSEGLRVLVLTKMREVLRSFALSLLAEEVDVLCGALYSHKGKGHCHRGGSERGLCEVRWGAIYVEEASGEACWSGGAINEL